MRRPHVYERSAPRPARQAYDEPTNQTAMARTIAAQLGNLIDKADSADLQSLANLLENARLEAERIAGPAAAGLCPTDHLNSTGHATDAIDKMDAAIERHKARREI